jgi:DNA-binding IclR family transcriptional regulator
MSADAFYIPKAESLAARVVAYFARLDDEELSVADIAQKWNGDSKNVSVQLERAVSAGLLKKDGTVYSAGPNIGRFNLTPAAVGTMHARPPTRRKVLTAIDIEAIEFEDAPPEVASPLKPHDRWLAKLRTMPAGKSFTVGYEYRHALRTAVSELRKQGWKLSVLAEGEEKVRVVCMAVPEVQS